MVKLGDKVKDTVSGFEGIAVGSHKYLHGCLRITVQPKVDKEGKLPECQTFDELQLEVLVESPDIQDLDTTGGPMPYVPKSRPGE